jgi:hypothetical protein
LRYSPQRGFSEEFFEVVWGSWEEKNDATRVEDV